jgi:hypothetical protein
MAQNQSKSDVRTTSGAYRVMEPRLKKINALMGGTETMRLAGRDYLPQYARESDRNYTTRLNRTVLFNYFRRTVDSMGGKPFVEPVRMEGYPPELEALQDDVDRQGNELTVFAQRSFSEAIAKGMTGILVDYPDIEAVTLADEMEAGARPFFQMISPENMLAVYSSMEEGREVITLAKILVQDIQMVDYAEIVVEKVIVMKPNTIEVWGQNEKKTWTLESSRDNSLGEVPLIIYYASKEANMVARPVLQDLADKNIEHWQSSSDQRNILTVARFPILAGKGLTQKELEGVTLSPNQLLGSENADGEFYYVEHSGTAIAAGRSDMEDIKAEMANLAMDLLVKKFSRATATEKSLDAEEASSLLRMMVLSFEDAMERAFYLAGKRLGIKVPETASIEISTSATGFDNQKDIDALIAGLNSGALPPAAFIAELQRRKILDPDAMIVIKEKDMDEGDDREFNMLLQAVKAGIVSKQTALEIMLKCGWIGLKDESKDKSSSSEDEMNRLKKETPTISREIPMGNGFERPIQQEGRPV